MKKIISVLTIICLVLLSSTFTPNDAFAEINSEKECSTCQKDSVQDAINILEEQGTEVIQEVSKKSKEKAIFIVENDNTNQSRNKIISNYLKQGFKKVEKAQSFVEFKNLVDQGIIYENIMSYTVHYYNQKQQKIVSEVFWIDMKNEKILTSTLTSFNLDNENGVILDVFKDQPINSMQDNYIIQARGFTFNGVSFACGMSGLIACASMCAGLHFIPLVGVGVGVTCDFLCGTAFAAGCSIS